MTTLAKLYYASPREQRAVAWLKRNRYREGTIAYALGEVAYDPKLSRVDWRSPSHYGFAMQAISRATWVSWRSCPYGNPDMNQMHQLALRCIRRNVYFPDLAKKLGRRKWEQVA